MTTLKTYSSILFFCAFAIGLFAQAAPDPRGGGPLQNPRPTNSNPEGGGDELCEFDLLPLIDLNIFIDADYQAFEESYTIPSGVPSFHIAVYFNEEPEPIFVTPGIRTFTNSNYICDSATPFDGYFYHHMYSDFVPVYLDDFIGKFCDADFYAARYNLTYILSTYESDILIPYPTEQYSEYFDCISHNIKATQRVCYICPKEDGENGGGIGTGNGSGEDGSDDDKAEKRSIEISTSSIYPNPFRDQITIEKDIIEIKIIDLKGAEVYSEQNPERIINTSSLQEGMYIIQYTDGNSWKATKMIKHN